MRDAIVEQVPMVDFAELTREIARDHVKLQDCERRLEVTEGQATSLRAEKAARRIDLGRKLIAAKGDKKNIKHGSWLPYLEKLGIAERTAQEWMKEAGWVEFKSAANPNAADLSAKSANTRRESGVDTRPRKRDEVSIVDEDSAADRRLTDNSEPKLDIQRELGRINEKVLAWANGWPTTARRQLAHELRQLAEIIEEGS